MTHGRDHQREVLTHLFADLATGSAEGLRAACSPDVSWWLPLDSSEYQGVTQTERALLQAFSGRAADLQSLILDGDSAVLEHLLHLEAGGTTPATSVLTLREDVVVAGRTYLDVAAWGGAAQVVTAQSGTAQSGTAQSGTAQGASGEGGSGEGGSGGQHA